MRLCIDMECASEDQSLSETTLPCTAARGRFKGKVAIVTGGASGKTNPMTLVMY